MTEALAAPGALWLPPGKSVTIFDAARSRAAAWAQARRERAFHGDARAGTRRERARAERRGRRCACADAPRRRSRPTTTWCRPVCATSVTRFIRRPP